MNVRENYLNFLRLCNSRLKSRIFHEENIPFFLRGARWVFLASLSSETGRELDQYQIESHARVREMEEPCWNKMAACLESWNGLRMAQARERSLGWGAAASRPNPPPSSPPDQYRESKMAAIPGHSPWDFPPVETSGGLSAPVPPLERRAPPSTHRLSLNSIKMKTWDFINVCYFFFFILCFFS